MTVGKDNRGGDGNVHGTYEMKLENQPEGCPGFYFEVELMPGAVVDSYSCFGISRWENNVDSRKRGDSNSFMIRLNDGDKYPGGDTYIPNFTSATMS